MTAAFGYVNGFRERRIPETESWVYDANGNITSETRPDGKTTTFTYSGGLLTGINGPGATW